MVVAAVFVPLLDLVMAVVRRVSKGRSPFSADKMHLHHRLLGLGHSHRSVVLLLYMWVSVVASAQWPSVLSPAPYALAGILISLAMALCTHLVLCSVLRVLARGIRLHRKGVDKRHFEPPPMQGKMHPRDYSTHL